VTGEHQEENMSTIELVRPVAVPFPTAPKPLAPLTRRERVVLSNLSEDVTLEQIASKLFVTRNTVKSQVRSLYRKLGVSTRAEAVAWARAAGLR
jgi:LuxR family transcriptional regulator, transcriptional regulator of spore coat protein